LLGVSTAAIEAETQRCIGLASRDVAALTRALEAFSKMRAEPFVARVRCERALISGDAEDLEAGLAVLEALGDVEQVQRYERRRA
jgi:predicted RNA polymerase sigma factor